MYYADLRASGYRLLRHHDRSFDPQHRLVTFGCRAGGPDQGDGEGFDAFGLLTGCDLSWGGEETHGAVDCWGLWELDPDHVGTGGNRRGIPSWAQVWGAVTDKASGAGGFGGFAPGVNPGINPAPDATGFTHIGLAGDPGAVSIEQFLQDPFGLGVGSNPTSTILDYYGLNFSGGQNFFGIGGQPALTTREKSDSGSPSHPTTQEKPAAASDPPRTVAKDADPNGPLQVDVGPVRQKDWKPDPRFKVKPLALPPFVRGIPKGVGGVVVQGTEEYEQHSLFAPSMPNLLVSPHHEGSPDLGGVVYDLTAENELDKVRNAHLQTLTRVFQTGDPATPNQTLIGLIGPPGKHALAIQAGPARGRTSSRAAFADYGHDFGQGPVELIGLGSWQAGGPFHPGCKTDIHGYSATEDEDRINSLHLWTGAYFFRDPSHDAPLEFGGEWEQPTSGGSWWQTFLRYDGESKHQHPTGNKSGLWRWETRIPFYYPPPPDKPGGGKKKTPRDDGATDGLFPDEFVVTDAPPDEENTTNPKSDNVSTDPGIDSVTTDPKSDSVTTDAFHDSGATDPMADYQPRTVPIAGYTNTPENPDADQSFPGANPTGNLEISPGRTNALTTPFQSVFMASATVAAGRVGPGRTPTVSTLNSLAAPGFVGIAQSRSVAAPNYQGSRSWGPREAATVAATSPAVINIECVGAESTDGSWFYDEEPGGTGPHGQTTTTGGAWVMPPGMSTTDYLDGTVPPTYPDTHLAFWNSSLGFGDPARNGSVANGYQLYLDTASGTLNYAATDASGATTSTGQLIPPVTGAATLTTGTFAGRPGTPAAVGDTYVCTDKIDNNGTSGNLDATEFFSVGALDALTWAKLAIINGFPQTVSSNWTFSGSPRVSGDLAKTGSGTIDANKLVGVTVSTGPTSGRALVYNGTTFVTTGLGVAGGGTGLTALAGTNSLLYVSAANTLTESGAPSDTKGGMAFQTTPASNPAWSRNLTGGDQTGADQNGVDRTIEGMRSTGTGVGGGLFFKTTPAGSSGSTNNALVTAAFIDGSSNVVLHGTGSALATNATNGFAYLPFCAGSPSGTPAHISGGFAGSVPTVVDTTNKQFFAYIGGVWENLSSGGASTLAATLATGNITGGSNIELTTGDAIYGDSGGTGEVLLVGNNVRAQADGGYFGILDSTGNVVHVYPKYQVSSAGVGSGSIFAIDPSFDDSGAASATTLRALNIAPVLNWSGTATGKYELLVVDPVAGAGAPSGANLLAAFRYNSADRFTLTPGGTATLTGTLDVSSYVRAQRLVTASASGTNPATPDARTAYTNEGATSLATFNLPTAAANLEYVFYVQDADGVRVVAATGDTIRIAGSVSATGGRIDSTTVGSVVTLLAINATEWVATSSLGTWTVT